MAILGEFAYLDTAVFAHLMFLYGSPLIPSKRLHSRRRVSREAYVQFGENLERLHLTT